MSNLLEKSLLTGFGIIVLIIFFTFINPFLENLINFNQKVDQEIKIYLKFFDEVDQGILYVIDTDLSYTNNIAYPNDINITIDGYFVKYDYFIEGNYKYRIMEYEKQFFTKNYFDFPSGVYFLNISVKESKLEVKITESDD
jgi:hypothetical protein